MYILIVYVVPTPPPQPPAPAATMEEEIVEEHAKLKEGMVKVLKCMANISSAAAVVNPIFGVAGSLMRVVLHHIDDEDIRKLKREFGSVNRALDELSRKNRQALVAIQKETLDSQYASVEENLKNQFRKFMELLEARPEHSERKKEDFARSYADDLGDQNLHTLYDGVVGKPKLFSRPILEVSRGPRRQRGGGGSGPVGHHFHYLSNAVIVLNR